MPKLATELSAIQLKTLGVGVHPVGGVPGLQLQVNPSGSRQWLLRVRVGDKRREIGLGGFPGVTLAQAREKARDTRQAISEGRDPVAERQALRQELKAKQAATRTLEWCCRTYLADKQGEWKNPKHRAQWAATLETYVYPLIGSLDVAAVSLPHVLSVLNQPQTIGDSEVPLWDAKTETASRLRGRMETILDWATIHGYREGVNPARWKGHLDALLKSPKKIKGVKHHEALPVADVPAFMQRLRTYAGTAPRCLEWAILTASRSGNARELRWQEIDFKTGMWVIPGERMKAGREHRVPLSTQAISLLQSIASEQAPQADALVFPAPRGGVLSDMALTAVTRRMQAPCVPHGFRSSFRDWVADETNYPSDMAEFALAHAVSDQTVAAYLRTDMVKKRRDMMQDWADFCLDVAE